MRIVLSNNCRSEKKKARPYYLEKSLVHLPRRERERVGEIRGEDCTLGRMTYDVKNRQIFGKILAKGGEASQKTHARVKKNGQSM